MEERVKLLSGIRNSNIANISGFGDSTPLLVNEKPDPLIFSKFIKAVYKTADPSAPETLHDKQMKVFERVPGYVHPKTLHAKVVDAQRILFLEKIEAEEQSKLKLPAIQTEIGGIDRFSRVTSRDDETKRIYLLLKGLPPGQPVLQRLRLPKLPLESSNFEYSTGVDTVLESLPITHRHHTPPKSYGDQSKQTKSVHRIRTFAHQLVETIQNKKALDEAERKRQREASEIPSPEQVHQRLLEKRLKVEFSQSERQLPYDDLPNTSREYFAPSDRQIKKKLIGNVKEIRKELQRVRLQHLMARDKDEAAKITASQLKPPAPELFEQHVKQIKKVLRSRRILNQDKHFLGDERYERQEKYEKRLESLSHREDMLKTSAQIVHRLIEERLQTEPVRVPQGTHSARPSHTQSHAVASVSSLKKQRQEAPSTDATHRGSPTAGRRAQAAQPPFVPPVQSTAAFKLRIGDTIRQLDQRQRANERDKQRVERAARRIDRQLGVFNKIRVDEFVKGCEDLELVTTARPAKH